jgi:hypothetical protein
MAKTKISEFSSTPANNTDIDSINIAEGCAPSNINDAIRELMAQLKDFQIGSQGDSFNGPIGTSTAAAGAFTTLAASGAVTLSGGTANGVTYLNGSKVLTSGSALTFDGAKLGIGNASPAYALQVDIATASGDLVGWFRQASNPVASVKSGSGYAGFGQGAASSETRIFADGETSFITNYLGGTEQMRLTSTGLGIGTSSPAQKLTISGTAATNMTSIGLVGSTTGYQRILMNNTSGGAQFGIEGSTASTICVGSTAYATVMGSYQNYPTQVITNNNVVATFDTAGNLGLGVTPSAWATYKAFDIGYAGNGLHATGQNDLNLASNVYYNAGYKYAGSARANLLEMYNGEFYFKTAGSGTAGNAISFTQAMTLDANGNLMVGTTTQLARANFAESVISGEADVLIGNSAGSGTNNTAALYLSGQNSLIRAAAIKAVIGAANQHHLAFFTNFDYDTPTERARIDSSGNLLVGTTTASGKLFSSTSSASQPALRAASTSASYVDNVFAIDVDRNTTNNTFYVISYYNNGAAAHKFRVADSGNVTNTNNSYGAISDVKLKENIVDATPKLAALQNVRIVNYNRIGSEEKELGVIAQELEQVFPALVETHIDRDAENNDLGTTTKSVKYSVFVPMLIKAIQEQQALITQLQADVATLKGN